MEELNIIKRIQNCLGECLNMLSSEANFSYAISSEIDKVLERLIQPMQLAIIGKISSSKSTLVNAILGEEVVRTGQMEETFNVSWLKYGASDADIIIYFKDKSIQKVARKDWVKWASHQEENRLKEDVQYIEVAYEHEILKHINIIDTPGLDAISQVDSQNTIDFLKKVQPDAVVVLFTHGSIASNTMEVLQMFQQNNCSSYNLNPLNAIGVLAKADTIWNIGKSDSNILSEGKRVIETLYKNNPSVSNSLYTILPISSLMSLSIATINNKEIDWVKKLSMTEESILKEMLSSPKFFKDNYYNVGISGLDREKLESKFGLYGLYLMLTAYKKNPDTTIEEIKQLLKKESGFKLFSEILQNHFGNRAALIKVQNLIRHLIQVCKEEKKSILKVHDSMVLTIEKIQNKIITLLLSIHEYQEIKLLTEIYEGKINLPNPQVEEFKYICGEYGHSVLKKLAFNELVSIENMKQKAKERVIHWQKQYNIISMVSPTKAQSMKIMMQSYNLLLNQINNIEVEIKRAEDVLDSAKLYFYGV